LGRFATVEALTRGQMMEEKFIVNQKLRPVKSQEKCPSPLCKVLLNLFRQFLTQILDKSEKRIKKEQKA